MAQPAQKTAERKPARPRLVTEPQRRVRMRRLKLFDQPLHVLMRPAQDAPAPHLRAVTGRNGNGDRVVVDIHADEERERRARAVLSLDSGTGLECSFHVSAFLSLFVLLTRQCGSALRHTPARNPRSRKADSFSPTIASQSD